MGENMREYLKLENMLNPPATFDPESVTTTGGVEGTRFTINTKEGTVKSEEFPNTINSFDFPTINEEYRGKKYCITYGMAAFAYSRVAVVKKNVCDPRDRWSLQHHCWFRGGHQGGCRQG